MYHLVKSTHLAEAELVCYWFILVIKVLFNNMMKTLCYNIRVSLESAWVVRGKDCCFLVTYF
jgi:hypothetical protein